VDRTLRARNEVLRPPAASGAAVSEESATASDVESATTSRTPLACTAIEAQWAGREGIVFLGSWCTRFSRRHVWEGLGAELMSSPWEHRQSLTEAYEYLGGIYESTLAVLAEQLDDLHGTSHDIRYWRIIIGPWLRAYLHSLYDRYAHLAVARDRYASPMLLGASCGLSVATDTADHIRLVASDAYNLELFTRLARTMGVETETWGEANVPPTEPVSRSGLLGRTARSAARASARRATRAHDGNIVLYRQAYFPRDVASELHSATGGRFVSVPGGEQLPEIPAVDSRMREQLSRVRVGEAEFESVVGQMIGNDVPRLFVEGYENLLLSVAPWTSVRPRYIMSANSWYFDEPFKLWAAESAESGTRLLGCQHGGNYGLHTMMTSQDMEREITDRYYTWGWSAQDGLAPTVPMPAPKLMQHADLSSAPTDGVLLIAGSGPRYLFRFPEATTRVDRYVDAFLDFPDGLSDGVRGELRFRPHMSDYGWDIRERWKTRHADVPIEEWSVDFAESLASCRIFVCNHLSTTYAEALAAGKPTILFWDLEHYPLTDEARVVFDHLRDAGVLFDTARDAAVQVSAVYDRADEWWNEPERQSALRGFREVFARTSATATDEWAAELNGLLSGGSDD
jgi:putative transferase (TIGR04331 family)